MFRYARLTLNILGLACAALCVLRPELASEVGFDVWNLIDPQSNMAAQQRFAQELDQQDEIIKDRIAAKTEIIREVLADRLTLLEAAASFRHVTANPREYPGHGPEFFPGQTESERYCHQVLHWVKCETHGWAPSHAEAIWCRLTAELDEYLASHDGEVILPEI